jgi:hypothetical protein
LPNHRDASLARMSQHGVPANGLVKEDTGACPPRARSDSEPRGFTVTVEQANM